jgi:DNA-binding response OmpR family regulator
LADGSSQPKVADVLIKFKSGNIVAPLILPRRELCILEYFHRNRGRSVTKTQVFNAVYDVNETGVSDTVVEGHISKLRKKLRQRLGYDPIVAKRFEGYTYLG